MFTQETPQAERSFAASELLSQYPDQYKYKIYASDESTIFFSKKGQGIAKPITIVECFQKAVENHGSRPALCYERSEANKKAPSNMDNGIMSAPREKWDTFTWSQYYNDSRKVAKSSILLGMEKYDGCAIWGFNSPFWCMAGIGTMFGGGAWMGIYPTDTDAQVQYKVKHCACTVAFVDSADKQKKLEQFYNDKNLHVSNGTECKLRAIVCWNEPAASTSDLKIFSWNDFLAYGTDGVSDGKLDQIMGEIKPNNAACYVYTSGTTGNPKACMITHDNLTWDVSTVFRTALARAVPENVPEQIRSLSYLPLSHVAACLLDIIMGVCITSGHMPIFGNSYQTSYFARPYDLRKSTIGKRLLTVRPVIFLAVPRVWEKIEAKMKTMAKSGCIGSIIQSLKDINEANAKAMQIGGTGKKCWGTCLGNKIGNTVKSKLGLDECLLSITGAAPTRESTLRYFASIGLDIYEVYGMSEMTGGCTANFPGCCKWGTIGVPVDGVEAMIFNEKDEPITEYFKHGEPVPEKCMGEMRTRGRGNFMGYLANPKLGQDHVDEILMKNKSCINAQGWICSGDKAARSDLGVFKITGRYKELIITAGGENVAPVPMEDNMKVLYPGISNVMMYGDKRPFNVALICMAEEAYTAELPGNGTLESIVYKGLPKEASETKKTESLFMADENHPIIAKIISTIESTNKNGAVCPSNACTIKKFAILPADFSVKGNELTPTMKLKRGVVAEKYETLIQKIYDAPFSARYVPFAL